MLTTCDDDFDTTLFLYYRTYYIKNLQFINICRFCACLFFLLGKAAACTGPYRLPPLPPRALRKRAHSIQPDYPHHGAPAAARELRRDAVDLVWEAERGGSAGSADPAVVPEPPPWRGQRWIQQSKRTRTASTAATLSWAHRCCLPCPLASGAKHTGRS